jgi:hypothetical protein
MDPANAVLRSRGTHTKAGLREPLLNSEARNNLILDRCDLDRFRPSVKRCGTISRFSGFVWLLRCFDTFGLWQARFGRALSFPGREIGRRRHEKGLR